MSELHEVPEEIFLQVDPEGDGPGEWDTIDGATWCGERINHNDVRYVRADLVAKLEEKLEVAEHREAELLAENKELRADLESLRLMLS